MIEEKLGKYLDVVTDGINHYVKNRKGEHIGEIGTRWKKPVISIGDLDFDSTCLRDIADYLDKIK